MSKNHSNNTRKSLKSDNYNRDHNLTHVAKVCNEPLFVPYRYYPSCDVLQTFKDKNITKKELKGLPVVFPWNKKYDSLRSNVNSRFVVFPTFIVMAESNYDIIKTLKFAQKYKFDISLRSGGHCYEPFSISNGIIIDQSLRKSINVNKVNKTVTVEAGVVIGELVNELSKYGLALPTGTCANVGIMGLTLGGGIGFLTRTWGLTLDNLIELEIILASGKTIIANATPPNNADLFWACQGAGGGNFGVVTKLTFKLHELVEVVLYELSWPYEQMVDVADVWQRWAPFVSEKLNSEMNIYNPSKPIIITGQYIGQKSELEKLLLPLIELKPSEIKIWRTTYLDSVRHFTGRTVRPPFFKNKSNFVNKPFPKAAFEILNKYMKSADENVRIEFEAFGGNVNKLDSTDTAFPVRDSLFWIQLVSYWYNQDMGKNKIKWVTALYEEIKPYLSGNGYINCPDTQIEEYIQYYYGGNSLKLLQIKKKYDPDNVFSFKQSLPVYF